MTKFRRKFFTFLEQDSAGQERAAMETTLDQDTDPAAFDAGAGEGDDINQRAEEAAAQMAQHAIEMKNLIDTWTGKISEFEEFLNGSSMDSVNTIITKANDATIIGKMKKERTTINRIASELAGLAAKFQGYYNMADDPANKYV